jgi:hypothetical protein
MSPGPRPTCHEFARRPTEPNAGKFRASRAARNNLSIGKNPCLLTSTPAGLEPATLGSETLDAILIDIVSPENPRKQAESKPLLAAISIRVRKWVQFSKCTHFRLFADYRFNRLKAVTGQWRRI